MIAGPKSVSILKGLPLDFFNPSSSNRRPLNTKFFFIRLSENSKRPLSLMVGNELPLEPLSSVMRMKPRKRQATDWIHQRPKRGNTLVSISEAILLIFSVRSLSSMFSLVS